MVIMEITIQGDKRATDSVGTTIIIVIEIEDMRINANSFSFWWVVLASSVTNCVRFAGVGGAAVSGRLSAANPHVSQLEQPGNAAVYR